MNLLINIDESFLMHILNYSLLFYIHLKNYLIREIHSMCISDCSFLYFYFYTFYYFYILAYYNLI